MPENALQTLQQLIQHLIAPDVRERKIRLNSLEKQIDVRFASVDGRLNALVQKMDIQFRAIMAAIAESKAQAELVNLRVVLALSERVGLFEARSQ